MHLPRSVALSHPLGQSRLLRVAAALLAALVALSIFVLIKPGPLPLDVWAHRQFAAHRGSSATAVAKAITFTGSGPFVYPMAILAAVGLWQLRGRAAGLALLLTVVGGAGATGVLKVAVGRHRPAARDMLGTAEATLSFPSGHTTSGVLLFVGTAMIATITATAAARAAALSAAIVWAAAIAWSRLYLGFHWLSDVVASALLGTSALLICAYVLSAVVVPNWGRDDEGRRRMAPARLPDPVRAHPSEGHRVAATEVAGGGLPPELGGRAAGG
ncbi:MAG: hypothetical protein JWN20_359 [Jatrophihabitantaceae bacterium]|nr:hypothetical protein [Jatrophihabitantaceae bacterium]